MRNTSILYILFTSSCYFHDKIRFLPYTISPSGPSILFPKEESNRHIHELNDFNQVSILELRPLMKENGKLHQDHFRLSYNEKFFAFDQIIDGKRLLRISDLAQSLSYSINIRSDEKELATSRSDRNIVYSGNLNWSNVSEEFTFISSANRHQFKIYIGNIYGHYDYVSANVAKEDFVSWHPTSSEFVYTSSSSGNGDLYIYNSKNRQHERLTHSPNPDFAAKWTPTGRSIVYTSGDSNNHNIMILNRKDGKWSKGIPLIQSQHDEIYPSISPSGSRIAFFKRSQNSNQWDLYHTKYSQATPHIYKPELIEKNTLVGRNNNIAWSPDSKYIFFISAKTKYARPIYVYDLDKNISYPLNTSNRMNRDLRISPSGILSFCSQFGPWDRIYLAKTNLKPVKYRNPNEPIY